VATEHTSIAPQLMYVLRTKLYNKLPGYIKQIDSYKTLKKELKSLLLHSFYSMEESVVL